MQSPTGTIGESAGWDPASSPAEISNNILVQVLARVPMGVWIIVLLIPALVPLGWLGFFESHDGLFHVYRLAALDKAVRAGVLYPRWFPEFAFGYGHPVLNFYGPLSYYWGLPFTLLGSNAAQAMKLVLATGLIGSALGMYLLARLHLDRVPSLVAAVVYAYLPYHLVDLYVRGAVAEFLAFVWFPLILWAFHRLIESSARYRLHHLALASLLFVALILTHNLSAFIFAPVLGLYVLILLIRKRSLRALGYTALALILTGVLSTFYWLPILTESGYVGLGYGTSQGYQDHLLTYADLVSLSLAYDYSIEPGIPITFPLGWVQIIILFVGGALVFRIRRQRPVILLMLATALISIFMLTTSSLPLWRTLESGLAFLQYPWRFQALTALATALLAGVLLHGLTRRPGRARLSLAVFLLVVTGAWALWALPVTLTLPDLSTQGMWHLDRRINQIGATWTGEYLPIWVREQRWAISHPAPASAWAEEPEPEQIPDLRGSELWLTGVGYTRYNLTLDTPHEVTLALHQFYYPGWQASWQGETISAYPKGDLGLAAFDLPAGSGPLTLRLALTPSQAWGTLISLVAALVMGVGLLAQFQMPKSASGGDPPTRSELLTMGILTICYLLLAAVLLANLALPNGYLRATNPVNANLEDIVELQAFAADESHYRPGDTVKVTLYWMAMAPLNQDYKTFIHLTDAEVTRQPTQHDDDPGGNFTPTTRWMAGELVPDTHYLTLPGDLSPGRYNLWADMYEYPSVRNLAVLSADAETDGRRVLLSEIQVIAP